MEKIKVVIVEDEFVIAEDISSKLTLSGYEILGVFDKAEDALPFMLIHHPDILLADITLTGSMDGIQMVESTQAKIQLPVIYITANSDAVTYARARSTNPNAFLVKPFSPANLLAAVDLALFNFSSGRTPELIERPRAADLPDTDFIVHQSLFIRTNGKYKKILSEDLLFVEASGSYVHLQTTSERFTLSQNLTNFQKKNPLPNLLRVHRSYLVNLNKVDSFEESFLFIQRHKLPISENYRAEFLSRIHCL